MAPQCQMNCYKFKASYPSGGGNGVVGGSVYATRNRCQLCSVWLDNKIYTHRCPCCKMPLRKRVH